MYTHQSNVITQGKSLAETGKALIMIHGRGATAESILSLAVYLPVKDFTLFAPQATNHSWYPYSFMAPVAQNQPALTLALEQLDELVKNIKTQGVASENIYLLGFSQGACLTAEFAARHAQKFGGLFIFTGGLIGQTLLDANYQGRFEGTPVLITTGDPDMHVPLKRVEETVKQLESQGALITKKIYQGRPHTITQEEIELACEIFEQVSSADKR
ncbi:alpha/beta hydrolase [Rufibacter immobilis]|uniref:alpha/beta hydrolase n=1 Tax=Rufibacter immobilis TaxID=1348778 RepID=UPI0035EAC75B